jgi:uncharacterized protein with PIN domain
MADHFPTRELPTLIADATLGRLAKWLRLAGIDTLWDPYKPDVNKLLRISSIEHRVVLTRTTSVFLKLGMDRCRFIQSNDVMKQVRQVIDDFQIHHRHLRILTICANCNHLLSQIGGNDVRGYVPDYILMHHEKLMTCNKCRRIYWPGSHVSRINSIIEGWFTR